MKGNQKHKDPLDAYKVFPTRLRSIMAEKRVSRQELASTLGISRQAVSNYADGSSTPSWEGIVTIARTLGVTSDFLLGLSDYRTVETQGITLHNLGFSEAATKNLVEENNWSPDAIRGLSIVLENDRFAEVFQLIPSIASLASRVIDEIENDRINNEPPSYSSVSSYRKNELVMSLDVFNYLSFSVDEVAREFRKLVAIQTRAERPAELYNQYLKRMHDQEMKKKDATPLDTKEDDCDGIDTQKDD